MSILIYLYLPFIRSTKEATKEEGEIIEIMWYRVMGYIVVNSTESFLSGLIMTRRLLTRNPLSIPSGLTMLCNISSLLSVSGVSFTLANKILDTIEPYLKNDLDRFEFKWAERWLHVFSAMRNCHYEQELVDFFIKQGNFHYTNYYLEVFGVIFVSMGSFNEAEEMAKKLLEIAESYDNEGALLLQYNILIFIDHAKRSTSGMLEHENLRIDQTKKMGDRTTVKLFLAYKTDALMMRGNMQEAAVLIDEMVSLIQEEKFVIADQILPPLMSMLSFNIHSYNLAKDEKKRKEILKKSNHLLKQIRKYGPKLIFRYPEALRLSGTFCLLAGRQSEALKYWQEGLALGERLGTKPEFGRISFEVAKYLSSPGSRVKTLGKLGFEHYAKVAREIFVEIGLDVDLKELDEWERGLTNK
jgi:tetratricopeptide (TPR) repeat protein